jgi:hypothetical protein
MSWARRIKSTSSHNISWRFILISPSSLHWCVPCSVSFRFTTSSFNYCSCLMTYFNDTFVEPSDLRSRLYGFHLTPYKTNWWMQRWRTSLSTILNDDFRAVLAISRWAESQYFQVGHSYFTNPYHLTIHNHLLLSFNAKYIQKFKQRHWITYKPSTT